MNVDNLKNLIEQFVREDVKQRNAGHNRVFFDNSLLSFACKSAPASVAPQTLKHP